MRLGQLLAQRVRDRRRDAGDQIQLIEQVSIALEQPHPVQAQREDVVATARLQEPSQRSRVEAVGDHDELRDGLRNS